MILYPTTFPTADIQTILTDILGNKEISDAANFAKALWELTGFALGSAFGEPAGAPTAIHANAVHLTDFEVMKHLQDILAHLSTGQSIETIVSEIPWAAIIKWALTQLLALTATATATATAKQ